MENNKNINESEIERYKRLAGMMLNAVDSLKDTIRKYDKNSDEYLDTLAKIETGILKDEFTIGLFGVTGAGKSTFINALLGKELMKSGLGETSRVITELRPCDKKHPDGTTVIIYKSRKELFDELTQVIQEELGETQQDDSDNSKKYTFDTQNGIDNLLQLIAKHDEVDPGKIKSLNGYIQGWDEYFKYLDSAPEVVDFKENDNLLHNRKYGTEGVELGESYAVYVKQRTIYTDCPFLNNGVVLLDTPGFGSGIQRHTTLAEEVLKKVDVALIMTKIDYKFAQPDREFIKKIFSRQKSLREANTNAGYNEFPLEIAFILNQIGYVVPFTKEAVSLQEDQLREKLQRFKLENIPVFSTDAACALWSAISRDSTRKLSEREHDNFNHYAILKDASPEKNLECSRFYSIIYDELPKYLAKVKYTSVLGKNFRDISILTNQCRKSIERRIDYITATAEEIKDKRDKFEKDVETCQEQLEYVNAENVRFLLKSMVSDFCANELTPAIDSAKKNFVESCKKRKFKFEKLTWMDAFATKMLNDIISFIREKLTEKYCNLRNTELLSRVKAIMERYDFSKSLSLEGLKKSLKDLTMPSDSIVTSVGLTQILLSPLSMFDSVVEKMAEGFLGKNKDNIDGVLGAVIQHHTDSFQQDVGKIFNDLVQRVRTDFDATEKILFKTQEERENTEQMLAEYKQNVQEVFDSLSEIHEQIKRFSANQ